MGMPENWSGNVWRGLQHAAADDIAAYKAYGESKGIDDAGIDERSVVGLYGRTWSSAANEDANTEPHYKSGGYGSPTYQGQICDPNAKGEVEFWSNIRYGERSQEGYYTDSDGERVYGVPPNMGAVHKKGGGYIEGPLPGSDAEKVLGDGTYDWDDDNGYYVVNK